MIQECGGYANLLNMDLPPGGDFICNESLKNNGVCSRISVDVGPGIKTQSEIEIDENCPTKNDIITEVTIKNNIRSDKLGKNCFDMENKYDAQDEISISEENDTEQCEHVSAIDGQNEYVTIQNTNCDLLAHETEKCDVCVEDKCSLDININLMCAEEYDSVNDPNGHKEKHYFAKINDIVNDGLNAECASIEIDVEGKCESSAFEKCLLLEQRRTDPPNKRV